MSKFLSFGLLSLLIPVSAFAVTGGTSFNVQAVECTSPETVGAYSTEVYWVFPSRSLRPLAFLDQRTGEYVEHVNQFDIQQDKSNPNKFVDVATNGHAYTLDMSQDPASLST